MQTEEKSARFVRGIGPKRFEALNRLGVQSIRDLCYFFPRRYEDRSHFQSVVKIQPGEEATIRCEILALGVRPLKKMSVFEMVVGDSSGILTAVWFNQPYLQNQFHMGDRIILSGKVEKYHDRLQMNSPEYERVQEGNAEAIHTGRITPIYSLSEGLAQRSLRAAMKEVADNYVPKEISEFLPESILKSFSLMHLPKAVQTMHFPETTELLEAARRRIIFDEFFLFELLLLSKIRMIQRKERSIPFQDGVKMLAQFQAKIPLALTKGQLSAIHEILADVSNEIPMNRLLQGEVGSGKTMVAAYFLYLAAQNHLQAALLVPTEILAEQHF
ncbi:MAG: DEAD/DEAH box helicase family protein, partial [Candidatus Omnitrophica bacterium]|nr:DEAD/DEAH box helicase family protein [Candidatus Omnitrophota bacterium]